MELSISWETIGKLALTGFVTYVVAPGLLVARDLFLWKIVEKFILNNHLRTLISMRANDVWYLNNKYNYQRELKMSPGSVSYYLNGIEVTQTEFEATDKAIKYHASRADKAGATILWRSNLVNWIFRHYRQEPNTNPIPEWEQEAYERAEVSKPTTNVSEKLGTSNG